MRCNAIIYCNNDVDDINSGSETSSARTTIADVYGGGNTDVSTDIDVDVNVDGIGYQERLSETACLEYFKVSERLSQISLGDHDYDNNNNSNRNSNSNLNTSYDVVDDGNDSRYKLTSSDRASKNKGNGTSLLFCIYYYYCY
jgi:hypothetical protein